MYYLFSFLYIKNWETGQYELSKARIIICTAGLLLLMVAILIITFMQTPMTYTA